jgi:hypothetical protein
MLRAEIRESLAAGFRQPEGHDRQAIAGIIGDRRFSDLERQGFCESRSRQEQQAEHEACRR